MSEIEALCAVGGETHVNNEPWSESGKEEVWYVFSGSEVTVQKGLCERPLSCPLRNLCTGKVRYSNKEDSGFSVATIREIVPTNFEKFEKGWAQE